MTFEFQDDEPVSRASGAGRTPEPNPFIAPVQSIALKTNPETGKPLAKSFVVDHDGSDDAVAHVNKLLRQLGKAGGACEPPVTCYRHAEPLTEKRGNKTVEVKGKVKIVFWTGPRQVKGHKPTDPAATQNTNQVEPQPATV